MSRLAVLSVLAIAPLFAAEPAAKRHQDFHAEAVAAYQRKDYAAAKSATLAALKDRPDSPRYLRNLAAVCALSGETDAALDALRRLAALGVSADVERDRDFASLQGAAGFVRILATLAANRAPAGAADVVAELPGRNGIIEGIAFRPRTGDLFLGDAHHRCIWRRDRDGRIARWTAEDEDLLGIFGIAIDEARNALWATTTALPEMAGYTAAHKGQAALIEFNLATSEIRRIVDVPGDGRDHGLGDLVVAPDGTVYASDSKAPVLWQLAPDAEEMVKLVEAPVFGSLQGLALEKRTLIAADYANGLFAIDLASGTVTALAPPPNTTLVGIDGLISVPGALVATQNGVDPQRVVRIVLRPALDAVAGVTVVASALPGMEDLSLLTLVNDSPTFIAGAGWEGFDPVTMKQPRTHVVRLFQVPVGEGR